MHVLEPSTLVLLLGFCAAGLIAVLAAAFVTADKLAGALQYGELTRGRSRSRGSRCVNVGRRPKRSKDCPVIGRRKHR
jgi:dienelactone hydrolase